VLDPTDSFFELLADSQPIDTGTQSVLRLDLIVSRATDAGERPAKIRFWQQLSDN
jgi:hypothetical protein